MFGESNPFVVDVRRYEGEVHTSKATTDKHEADIVPS